MLFSLMNIKYNHLIPFVNVTDVMTSSRVILSLNIMCLPSDFPFHSFLAPLYDPIIWLIIIVSSLICITCSINGRLLYLLHFTATYSLMVTFSSLDFLVITLSSDLECY